MCLSLQLVKIKGNFSLVCSAGKSIKVMSSRDPLVSSTSLQFLGQCNRTGVVGGCLCFHVT